MKNRSLEAKFQEIKEKLGNSTNFSIEDVRQVLDVEDNVVYLSLSQLVKRGLVTRAGKGLYTLSKKEDIKPKLEGLAATVHELLGRMGCRFFITGADVLRSFMPRYEPMLPVLVNVMKTEAEKAKEYLLARKINVMLDSELKNYKLLRNFPGITNLVSLNSTTDFSYSSNGIAEFERAFCDLFFEVTRKGYSMDYDNLMEIYQTMRKKIIINDVRMTKIASRRNLQRDFHFIIDYKDISSGAIKLVSKLVQNQEESKLNQWRYLLEQN